ncbi:helix-turn-helix domain-containing protein [Clostridium disporicum]|uniref:AraC-type DNA-binding domain-containing protein n=1 Tax=Clostridium disporicum TaxID=84024 RepID=A0A174HD01_9CLOT|nr:helix-turn-helix domain-containing protein [Clostridium disporicum]CUO72763.1 AraC-type DNA-binding domain-containing protein [Clostridium disporicum]
MNDNISLDKIKYLCNLTFNTFNTSVCYISNKNNILYSVKNMSPTDISIDFDNLLIKLSMSYCTLNIPILVTTKHDFKFIIINLIFKEYVGSIVIGPILSSPIDKNYIYNNNYISNIDKNLIYKYYSEIPVIEISTILNWISLLFFSIYNSPMYNDYILKDDNSYLDINFKVKNTYKTLLTTNRQNTTHHHSNKLIRCIYNDIKTGNIDKLLLDLKSKPDGELGTVVKSNDLRNRKNLIIALITLCTQASIDGGVSCEDAFTLSDSFIQNIEEINNISSFITIESKIPIAFAAKVKEVQKFNYSKITYTCIDIILKHLYEDISLLKISKMLNLSPPYISSKFKKEVKISLSEYILKCKIDEAKYLLTHTNYSILEVSTLLCFHDQSYFTKTFKRFTGITPKKYTSKTSI